MFFDVWCMPAGAGERSIAGILPANILHCNMPLVAAKSKGKKTSTVIADATDRLLRAVKQKMLRENGRIDYDQLAREGYSAQMIARLKTL